MNSDSTIHLSNTDSRLQRLRKVGNPPTTRILGGDLGTNQELRNAFIDLLLDVEDLPVARSFRVVRRLGSGRQGVVLEATSRGYLGCVSRTALKVFDPGIFPTEHSYLGNMRRVARQTGALQQLYHPNLVQCHELFSHRGIAVLSMELIDGVDLASMVDPEAHEELRGNLSHNAWDYFNDVIFSRDAHRLQPGVAIYVLRKILRGLERLHSIGYIHCDIKPGNIMIDRLGTLKLIDFGRATAVGDDDEFFLGSPLYMAPEMHERRSISPLVDLYSAGLVTIEMLHGEHLLDPRSTEDEIAAFKQDLPDRLGEFLPDYVTCNAEMMRILQRLIAVKPEDRYPDAAAAESAGGAFGIHRQLTLANLDTDYGRELAHYIEERLRLRVLPGAGGSF